MRFAYADQPYLGLCKVYGHEHNGGGHRPFDGRCWDDPETHRLLIDWLCEEYPDGWAMSLSEPSLRTLLPMTPPDARVGPWAKSFASFKKGVNPAYAWEPVIFRGGRSWKERGGDQSPTVRDWVVCPITMQRGFIGAKPDTFCNWVFGLLGAEAGDEFVDLFHGSGAVAAAWDAFCRQGRLIG